VNESLRAVLRHHCLVEKVSDLDTGARGKSFEVTLLKAFDLVGLEYTKNRASGAAWDFKATGGNWRKLVGEHEVNIKVAGARWMFGGTEFVKALPWDEIEDVEEFDKDKAAAKVRRILVRKKIPQLVFLKPKDKDVQAQIKQAVDVEDVTALEDLLVKSNFKISKLGRNFSVRVSVRDGKVGSIAVDKSGKVFMRSERPRKMGGSTMVGFRAPRDALKRVPVGSVKKP
jgi:hypothetical protein